MASIQLFYLCVFNSLREKRLLTAFKCDLTLVKEISRISHVFTSILTHLFLFFCGTFNEKHDLSGFKGFIVCVFLCLAVFDEWDFFFLADFCFISQIRLVRNKVEYLRSFKLIGHLKRII